MPETDRTPGTDARPIEARIVQSGVRFYAVGRDGSCVRADDLNAVRAGAV